MKENFRKNNLPDDFSLYAAVSEYDDQDIQCIKLDDNTCMCGKKNLINLRYIQLRNDPRSAKVLVGSCCVNKFMEKINGTYMICIRCRKPYKHGKYNKCKICRAIPEYIKCVHCKRDTKTEELIDRSCKECDELKIICNKCGIRSFPIRPDILGCARCYRECYFCNNIYTSARCQDCFKKCKTCDNYIPKTKVHCDECSKYLLPSTAKYPNMHPKEVAKADPKYFEFIYKKYKNKEPLKREFFMFCKYIENQLNKMNNKQ